MGGFGLFVSGWGLRFGGEGTIPEGVSRRERSVSRPSSGQTEGEL